MRCDIAPNAELLAQSCFRADPGRRLWLQAVCLRRRSAQQLSRQRCREAVYALLRGGPERFPAGAQLQQVRSRGAGSAFRRPRGLSGHGGPRHALEHGSFGTNGYSEIGLVVGANNVPVLQSIRRRYDRLFLLVPGFGAQGAGAKDVQYAFDRMGHGAVVMAGRSILYAYLKKGNGRARICTGRPECRAEDARADLDLHYGDLI